MPSPDDSASGPVFWGRLRSIFDRDSKHTGYDHASPRHRGFAIAISILVSALLWFVFSMQKNFSLVVDLPTVVVNLPTERALTHVPPRSVRIQVQGEGISLFQLYYNRPAYPLDASQDVADLESMPPELPKNLRLETVAPRTYAARTDERVTTTIPVRLRYEVTTPDTYELLFPPIVTPDSIRVSGARSIVGRLTEWPTERLRINSLTDSVAVQVALVDTLAQLVDRELETVTAIAVSREFTGATRVVEVIIEGAPSTEKLVTLEPSRLTVRYRVLLTEFRESQRAPDFFATVQYDEIRADTTGRVRPRVHPPANLTLRDMQWSPTSLRYFNYLIND